MEKLSEDGNAHAKCMRYHAPGGMRRTSRTSNKGTFCVCEVVCRLYILYVYSILERKYTKKHEWVSVKGDIGTVGITDFAAEQLGDIVFVELPDVGTELVQGDTTGAVESVKAASDIYAPVSGTVTEKNTVLESESGRINKSPFDEGWMYRLRLTNPKELSGLMDEKAYEKFKKEEEAEGH
ncbi:hypothetical protein Y032_0070g495 [Ancylostoma ceylanicum]|uniref:Glycine cleavage system H protein n=1 Tax=Ancylostoma ceylanicum TaxID=53326 RepID=A0A016TYA2_9BILA|nr:hypothetical protein Y032_0070g495 [Ancylostoma ceylanicum]